MHRLGAQESHPCGYGKSASGLALTVSQGVLVKEVLCYCRSGAPPHLAQCGHVVTQFFDGFYVLIQVMSLNDVTQMGVILFIGQFVQFQ